MPTLRKELQAIPDYVPGKSIDEIKEKYHLKSVIKLASNENPLGTSPLVKAALNKYSKKLHLYPRGDAPELVNALAKKFKVKPQNIIIGNGSDEILDLAARAYLEKGDVAAGAKETFSVYKSATIGAGAEYKAVPLNSWAYPLAELAKIKAKIIFICSPNNPTGLSVLPSELKKFLNSISKETLVVIDEAYKEFESGANSAKVNLKSSASEIAKLIRKHPNVLITRTFSKLYGLAGLRIGYGIADEKIIGALKKIKLPFNVNYLAQMTALVSLGDSAFVEKSLKMNFEEKEKLSKNLQNMGFEILPSQANFICVHIKPPCSCASAKEALSSFSAIRTNNGKVVKSKANEKVANANNSAAELTAFLEKNGIVVRHLKSFGMPEWVRITVGAPSQNKKLLGLIKKASQ